MSEKRRLSTRNRGEPPLKRRAVTPPPPPAPPAPPPRPVEPTELGLPIRLRDGQPLPTLPEPQERNLPNRTYQSISERSVTPYVQNLRFNQFSLYSGVLAASIDRSRHKWQADGVFERYWSKPNKKKGSIDAPNPAYKTMNKIGSCTMTIEPHAFDITLYNVKDLPQPYVPPNIHPPHLSTPQYNPFTYNAPPPSTHYPAYPGQQQTHPSQATLPPFREGFGHIGPQGPPPTYHATQPQPLTKPTNGSQPPSLPRSGSTGQTASQGQDEEIKSDPVIQMLATRAAANPDLKALMKVVANGKASPVQLREFQDHIDELNAILKARPNPHEHFYEDNYPEPPPHNQSSASRPPEASTGRPAASSTYVPPSPAPAPIKIEPPSQSYPISAPPSQPKAYPGNKPDVTSIVFDFGAGGDRYSFPRYSILEYLYSKTQVIVSFLVIRRGSMAAAGNYKNNQNYYQPVTMRLNADNSNVLEPLGRIVAPLDEVRSYMESVFKSMSPAENVYLATRLPRTADALELEKKEKTPQPEPQLIRATYSPPHSIVPLAA